MPCSSVVAARRARHGTSASRVEHGGDMRPSIGVLVTLDTISIGPTASRPHA
ncbi:Hypothetical protein A7982_02226 [Minicystis rosea]|nr:Hypothetical protein A7982_02226 [Minicystis rosea]